MDNLFKQTRRRFSGVGQEKREEPRRGEDLRIPPPKTVSFSLKEKKKDQNWIQRRLSSQMSADYDWSNGDEKAIAVAAAVYAISSLKEKEIPYQNKTNDQTKTTIQGKKEDNIISKASGEITEVLENPDSEMPITATTLADTKKPEKGLHDPSYKRTSSSFDKQLNGSFKPGSAASKPELPASAVKPARTPSSVDKQPSGRSELPASAVKPARTPSSVDKQPSGRFKRETSTTNPIVPSTAKPVSQPAETKRQSSTRPGAGKSHADIWEETEMARITERYEVQKTTILSWEDQKKKKAKRRLEKAERELEKTRAKSFEKFRKRIQNIDQVAGGARAKAVEKKKNDELKVKENANIIRITGKVPSTCSCF